MGNLKVNDIILAGDDSDSEIGRVTEIKNGIVTVAWEQGIVTTQKLFALCPFTIIGHDERL